MNALITALVASLSALLGAWAGARTALERFKSERAFDSRLGWYERLHKCLKDSLNKLTLAITSRSTGLDPAATWLDFQASLEPLAHASIDAELYAPNKSIAAVRTLQEQIRQTFEALLRDKTPAGLDALETAGRELSVHLRYATVVIATDVREHLGLEPLNEHLLDEGYVPEQRTLHK